MRRFNILYLIFPIAIYGLVLLYRNTTKPSVTFYGFAENKETEINLEQDVLIKNIAVITGQYVKKGDLLLEVSRTGLDLRKDNVSGEISIAGLQLQRRRSDITSDIKRLQSTLEEKKKETELAIQILEDEIAKAATLAQGLGTVDEKQWSEKVKNHPNHLKIKALNENLNLDIATITIDIQKLKAETQELDRLTQAENTQRIKTLTFLDNELKKLSVYAPSDGIIGLVNCRVGESAPAFKALISFYEKTPSSVMGYAHEGLLVRVKIGDSVQVNSFLRPELSTTGIVTGLGHRVIEIPERLRKIPEIKTYGREIIVTIPTDNPFLQKEKITLTLQNGH